MNLDNHFTQSELEFALKYLRDQMEWNMEDIAVEYDAGDKMEKLYKKINSYFEEVNV